jgi:hypothetical protein
MPTHICCLLHIFWGSFSISVKKPIFGKNLHNTVARVHSNAKNTLDFRLMFMHMVLIVQMYTMSACNAVTQSVPCWYAMVYRCGNSSACAEQGLLIACHSIDVLVCSSQRILNLDCSAQQIVHSTTTLTLVTVLCMLAQHCCVLPLLEHCVTVHASMCAQAIGSTSDWRSSTHMKQTVSVHSV